jgi:hypothetical protein
MMTEVELGQLLACVAESADVLSRGDFLSALDGWAMMCGAAVSSFGKVASGELEEISIDIPDPQEEIENPRRPRDG